METKKNDIDWGITILMWLTWLFALWCCTILINAVINGYQLECYLLCSIDISLIIFIVIPNVRILNRLLKPVRLDDYEQRRKDEKKKIKLNRKSNKALKTLIDNGYNVTINDEYTYKK